jgi:hypothetical protein
MHARLDRCVRLDDARRPVIQARCDVVLRALKLPQIPIRVVLVERCVARHKSALRACVVIDAMRVMFRVLVVVWIPLVTFATVVLVVQRVRLDKCALQAVVRQRVQAEPRTVQQPVVRWTPILNTAECAETSVPRDRCVLRVDVLRCVVPALRRVRVVVAIFPTIRHTAVRVVLSALTDKTVSAVGVWTAHAPQEPPTAAVPV